MIRSRVSKHVAPALRDSPLCIRFRSRDLALVRRAAATEGELVTVWIRETGLLRARQSKRARQALGSKSDMEDSKSACIAIRMTEVDYDIIRRVAQRDGAHVGSWLRSVSVQRAKAVLGKSMLTKKGKAA